MLLPEPIMNFYACYVYGLRILIGKCVIVLWCNRLKEPIEEKSHCLHSLVLVDKNPDGSIDNYALVFAPKIHRPFCSVKLAIFIHRNARLLAICDFFTGESMFGEMKNNFMVRFIVGKKRHVV